MKVRFFKPFDDLSEQSEILVDLKKPISVEELLNVIETRLPSFQRVVHKEGDEVQNRFVILVRGDEILKLKDLVQPEDVVKVLPPISGG
jgi:molybdopterin converting factor small subunit